MNPRSAVKTDNGFRDRRIRPLCHTSEQLALRGKRVTAPAAAVRSSTGEEAEKEGFEPSREEFTPLTP